MAQPIGVSPVDSPGPATVKSAQTPKTSLMLVGPSSWRKPISLWLEYEPELLLAAEIDPEFRPKHVFDLASTDVVIAYADASNPDPAVELALELQSRNRGAGIILVLSGLRNDMARRFSSYAGSWSMVTSRTSVDPVKLAFVIRSSARGMPIVESAVTKMLEAGWRTSAPEEDDMPELPVAQEAA